MGGFLGVGTSGAEKTATNKLDSVFNYGLGVGKAGESSGTSSLTDASAAFRSLIAPGRAGAAANAAPAINAIKDQADASKREEAATGTNRGGGTASANRESTTATNKTIDDIINENLFKGKVEGAKGLAETGGEQLTNASNLLGLGVQAEGPVLQAGMQQTKARSEIGAAFGGLAAKAVLAGFGL